MSRESAVRIAILFPDLLGTYGDSGNATVLARRLTWRGIEAEIISVHSGMPVPESCDLFLLGGGEDGPQAQAAQELGAEGALPRALESGAAVLAVCAGLQIVGREFAGPGGSSQAGLGLIDCVTVRGGGKRAVGELVADPMPPFELPTLTGYENHQGVTALGPGAVPLGRVRVGVGNGDGTEGAVSGRVLGTYLHGPVLARNPALADLVLSWIVGPLDPLEDAMVEELRKERLRAAVPGSRLRFTRVAGQ